MKGPALSLGSSGSPSLALRRSFLCPLGRFVGHARRRPSSGRSLLWGATGVNPQGEAACLLAPANFVVFGRDKRDVYGRPFAVPCCGAVVSTFSAWGDASGFRLCMVSPLRRRGHCASRCICLGCLAAFIGLIRQVTVHERGRSANPKTRVCDMYITPHRLGGDSRIELHSWQRMASKAPSLTAF